MALTILLNSLALKNSISYAGAVWFMNLSHDSQFVQNSAKKYVAAITLGLKNPWSFYLSKIKYEFMYFKIIFKL